ncbi:hypothetical protein SK128_024039 [Halocaridina rubra]|uniref:Uncharacterized protein n=1 Tax=Halocaridina rubra TaxID=373956 RepID=A0AAN9AGZ4_HALRR
MGYVLYHSRNGQKYSNNWGFCKDGSNQPGCGPQEVFRGCSDVAVFAADDPKYYQYQNLTTEADLSQFLHLKETPELQPDIQEEPNLPDAPNSNDVNVGQVDDGDLHKVKDIRFKTDDRFRSPAISESIRPTTRRPSITFMDDRQPMRVKTDNSVFRFSQVIGNDHQNQKQKDFPSAPPKKYVSSDEFRKNYRIDKGNPISAPTPFLPPGKLEPKPVVINPYSLGVTPSPLGPPLLFPPPLGDQSFAPPGGRHSVHTSQPPEDYDPILGDILGKSAVSPSPKSTLLLSPPNRKSESQELPLSTLKLLQNFPSLFNSGMVPTRAPVAVEINEDALQRLMILQQALGLATSSSTTAQQQESPLVFIVV